MNKNRLQKLAGLLKEAEDFDLSDNPLQQFYKFEIGEKAYDGFGSYLPEDYCTILDRRSSLSKVEKDPVKKKYLRELRDWLKNSTRISDQPWYLIEWSGDDISWEPQERLISQMELDVENGNLNEVEDFDLSDNPFIGPEQFYKKHYAILNNEDEEIVGFKDVVNENDFFNRVNRKRKESPDFKHAYDFLIENEPFFCEKYPGDEFEGDLTDPDYILTFEEWANDVKASIDNYREPLGEEDQDFDLSDNPVPNKIIATYKYEVPEFEIDLSNKGEVWLVDVEVAELKYSSGKVEWKIKVTEAWDISNPNNQSKVTNPQTIQYLENIIRTDKKVATAFDEAFDEVMTDLYGTPDEEYDPWGDDRIDPEDYEMNPER